MGQGYGPHIRLWLYRTGHSNLFLARIGKAGAQAVSLYIQPKSLCVLVTCDRLGLGGLGEQPQLVKTLVYLVLGLGVSPREIVCQLQIWSGWARLFPGW